MSECLAQAPNFQTVDDLTIDRSLVTVQELTTIRRLVTMRALTIIVNLSLI
jgi:hypothetical protein